MIRGVYADGPWGQVHARMAGNGGPDGPVIALFHESPLSSQVYADVLAELDPDVTAVAFDTPGYGASDPPPAGAATEIPQYAAALLAAIGSLGIGRLVVGGGHTGAALALEVAAAAGPERVPGVMMSGVPLFGAAERERYLASWAPPLAPGPDCGQFGWAVRRYQEIWGPDPAPGMLHLAVTEMARSLTRYEWAYNACFRYDPAPALSRLRADVLLITAEHDLFADRDERVLELAGHGRRVLLPGLPGQPHLREPARYARELSAFARAALAG